MSPKRGSELSPDLVPAYTTEPLSGSCGFPRLLYQGVTSSQSLMLSEDLGGFENKRHVSQGYGLCMAQAQTSPKHGYDICSQEKAI